MRQALPRHLDSIGFYGVYPNGVIRLTGHINRITYVCAQDNTVRELYQGVKSPLESCRPRGREKAIICIKVVRQILYVSPKSLRAYPSLRLLHQ